VVLVGMALSPLLDIMVGGLECCCCECCDCGGICRAASSISITVVLLEADEVATSALDTAMAALAQASELAVIPVVAPFIPPDPIDVTSLFE